MKSLSLGLVGDSLRKSRPEEALRVLKAHLASRRRYFWHNEEGILIAQSNLALCLNDDLGRHDEALVIRREVFARRLATCGVSDEWTINSGYNLSSSLRKVGLQEEARTLVCDQLLPVARRSLGPDHDTTIRLNHSLAATIMRSPECTRNDLCFESTHDPLTCPYTGDDLLEAETIMQDVVRRRRRVLGPAHPETLHAEKVLSRARAKLARA